MSMDQTDVKTLKPDELSPAETLAKAEGISVTKS